MEDNTTQSIFGLDLGGFFGGVAQQVAELKGYDNPEAAVTGEAAKALNTARITSAPGADVKQTPAVSTPGAWSQAIQKALPVGIKLSNGQMLLVAVAGVGILYLLLKK